MGLREDFRAGRKKRGLSLQQLAEKFSEQLGYDISRAALANYELGRTETPVAMTLEVIRILVEQWNREEGGRVCEDSEPYGPKKLYLIDYDCPKCEKTVPGPFGGANYCVLCGEKFTQRSCKQCSRWILNPEYVCCPYCGTKVE